MLQSLLPLGLGFITLTFSLFKYQLRLSEKTTLAIVQAVISLGFCGFGLFHLLWIMMDSSIEFSSTMTFPNIIEILDYVLVVVLGMMILFDAISIVNTTPDPYSLPLREAEKPKLGQTMLSLACIALGLITVLN